jgi:hypothetical protein
LGKPILDGQIFSLYPAEASQRIGQCLLGLIKGLPAAVTYGKKTKLMASPLRARTPWRNKQRRSARYEFPSLHSILIKA